MSDTDTWDQIASTIAENLQEIDEAFAQTNMPLKKQKMMAQDVINKHMLQIVDWEEFLVSEDYARVMALVDDWYRKRYGSAFETERDDFHSLIIIHDKPFPLYVPLTFSISGDEEGTAWVGRPASVQKEENPLKWVMHGPNINTLSHSQRNKLLAQATENSNFIRSINFDLRTLYSGSNEACRDLAEAVLADLQNAAQNLCKRQNGALRNAGWELCQAVEKVLKIYIHRHGNTPAKHHKLFDLAQDAENLGTLKINKLALKYIPSGSLAANLRYGGEYKIENGLKAYHSALKIIKEIALAVQIKTDYNIREARFLIKSPWISYDTKTFLETIKTKSEN